MQGWVQYSAEAVQEATCAWLLCEWHKNLELCQFVSSDPSSGLLLYHTLYVAIHDYEIFILFLESLKEMGAGSN